MTDFTVRKTCLNGWWDFVPVFDPVANPAIPRDGWHEGQYLVPSFWTKSTHGVRERGETYYRASHDPEIFASHEYEFLFDAFGYPPEWGATRAGWVRRTLAVEDIVPGCRYFLVFDAVMPKTRLFVNGQLVNAQPHIHPTLPLEADVTDYLHVGDNEIAVLIEDYDRDDQGRAKVPTGNVIPCDHSGIWQDVWLVERGAVYVRDVTIRTSTRRETITVIYDVTNTTVHDVDVILDSEVLDWQKNVAAAQAGHVRALPRIHMHIPAGQTACAEITHVWPEAEWWCPENPKLYWLKTVISYQLPVISGQPNQRIGESASQPTTQPPIQLPTYAIAVTSFERFGFREVWLEGSNIMLNDHPVHLFSDWGHKSSPYYYTEGWIRQWFGMMRDANMNHSRLHTHPHPPITMDLADEEGILITGETGMHGSGGAQAAASFEYWVAAADHVRRFVQRDKNHPSVILWSIENEMRWNTKGQGRNPESVMIQEELPKLRALFNTLDPTRPAYHDGDSSLWNEKAQPILSRHYGKEVAGIGWWDQTQPLHSGEMAFYHYAGPNNTLHLGNDAVYASFEAIDKAAALDAALIIETGRTLGVSCFGPWNLSCLENLRMESEDVKLDYADFTVPGVKPLQVPAHSSEFSFWREGNGYVPNHSFAIQADAFRPLAVIDRSLKSTYFAGMTFRREIFVVNDTSGNVEGTLEVTLKGKEKQQSVKSVEHIVLKRGNVASHTFEIPIPIGITPGTYLYTATFRSGNAVLDTWTRELRISERANRRIDESVSRRIDEVAVYGPGFLRETLAAFGVAFHYVDTLENIPAPLLILEKNTVQPGSTQNHDVHTFVQRGGRVIVMEQAHSLFPAVALEDKPVLMAFVRAAGHPVLDGLEDADFAYWGDDPYPLIASDAYVANKLYRKDDGRLMHPLLDAGEGGFGHGDLERTPLFEAQDGSGLILACQLRITDKLREIPTAGQLLLNLLSRAATYAPRPSSSPIVVEGTEAENLAHYVDAARSGRTVIVNDATPAALRAWSLALDVDLHPRDVGDVYQIVRVGESAHQRISESANLPNTPLSGTMASESRITDHELLSGVSHWDTCGIETYSYAHNVENALVGSTFIEPVEGLEALLVTPSESCLRELFVYEGRAEALRAHTLSRFLYAEKREEAVALGRIVVGEGQILFNQFAPPKGKRARYNRLAHRLVANLGYRFEGSLLDGDLATFTRATSKGYPQQVYVYIGVCDAALWQQMVESTLPSLERMLATPILNVAEWTSHTTPDGTWQTAAFLHQETSLSLPLSQSPIPIYLYYPVWSPAPRKNVETNLDVPNPEALTFMDVDGSGTVEVVINGHTHEVLILPATISDIPLEMGGNHVLVRWTPDIPGATLSMRWRNIMRQPEIGLTFGAGGSVD